MGKQQVMGTESLIALTALIFVAALLYASVGHAGASGYLAAMALFGVAPEMMKPTALALNVLVSMIATVKFYRTGCFSWRIFWPFALASVPFAFIGGLVSLPGWIYKPIVGIVLLYTAVLLMKGKVAAASVHAGKPPLAPALGAGAGIGLLSGLTGVGGGIFLSPLLLLKGWAEIRQTSGVAAAFILVNSIAGLLGLMTSKPHFPEALPLWAVAAVIGGFIGAEYGSRRLATPTIQRLLALVLAIAGSKMILTATL